MKRKPWIVLLAALLCGGAAGSLAFVYQQQAPARRPAENIATVPVAVAARDLAIGTVVTAADVRLIQWPREAAPVGAVSQKSPLVGRSVVETISLNEPIMAHNVGEPGVGKGVLALVPSGMRAVSIKVDAAGATFVKQNSHVDLIAAVGGGNSSNSSSRVLLQNVLVLAVAGAFQPPPAPGAPPAPKPTGASNLVTLLVTPAEAELLALASHHSTIHLALRNDIDDVQEKTPGARMASLLLERAPEPERISPPVARPIQAAPPKPRSDSVDMFRRSNRSVITIKPGS
jgi:pilus assembly protein CpaB